MPVSRRFACDPGFGDGAFQQMEGESRVEDVQPALHRHQFFHHAGEDLHAAAVADENHNFRSRPGVPFSSSWASAVFVDPAGQIVAHQAKRLLAAEVMALEQAEELMHVGHGTPLCVHERGVRVFSVSRDIGRFQRQRRIPGKDKAGEQIAPGGEVGVIRGVNLQQGVALVVEELNALSLAVGGGLAG